MAKFYTPTVTALDADGGIDGSAVGVQSMVDTVGMQDVAGLSLSQFALAERRKHCEHC